MTKYLMLLAAMFLLIACGGDDGNDPVDNEPIPDDATVNDDATDNETPDPDTKDTEPPDIDIEQPDDDMIVNWQVYAGLEWSPVSEQGMTWQASLAHCAAMDARLPNINELRKVIINCPGSTYGGACPVSDPDCLGSSCWSEDCRCDGTADSYSALGNDKNFWLWSSSPRADGTSGAWGVGFGRGSVGSNPANDIYRVRCVR